MAPQEKRPSHILCGPTLVSFVACQRWGQVSEATLCLQAIYQPKSRLQPSRHNVRVTGPAVPLAIISLCGTVLRKFDMRMRTSWKLNVAQCDVIPKISMILLLMRQPEPYWMAKQRFLLFGGWQICKKISSLLSSSI